jgi:hypothetical protein
MMLEHGHSFTILSPTDESKNILQIARNMRWFCLLLLYNKNVASPAKKKISSHLWDRCGYLAAWWSDEDSDVRTARG